MSASIVQRACCRPFVDRAVYMSVPHRDRIGRQRISGTPPKPSDRIDGEIVGTRNVRMSSAARGALGSNSSA